MPSQGAGTVGGTVTATRGNSNRSGAKKKSAARHASKRSPAKKPAATSRARSAPVAPPLTVRVLDALAVASRGHGADLAGIACIVLGLVAALGIYVDLGGPVGASTADGVGWVVGAARVVAPLLLVLVGVLLLRGVPERAEVQPDDPTVIDEHPLAPDHPFARAVVGGALLVVSSLGLLHLARGAPELGAGSAAVSDAAGYLGALIGAPLRTALSGIGAALVLVAVGVAGALVATRTPARTAASKGAAVVQAGARPVGRTVRTYVRQLFSLGSERRSADEVATGEIPVVVGGEIDLRESPGAPAFYDQDADLDAAPAKPKRTRKPKAPVSAPDPDHPPEQLEIALPPGVQASNWKLPPTSLLVHGDAQAVDRKMVEETGRNLEAALAEHGVETRLIGMTVGPTVTRYELELGPGVKVARVTSLHKDIAYAMATPDVRILAPIPGKQAIGVEIPNVRKQLVTVGDILTSAEARSATHPLEVAIGRDIDGKAILANLAAMPHILIAGATGAGKSSCLNSLLTSILMRSTPDQVRMILVDPKRVEMGQYNKLPHLLTEVVTVPKKAANALAWAVREMERRYDLLAECGFRDITGYNAAYDRGELTDPNVELLGDEAESVKRYDRMPFILVVIDELADLMMVAARDVEESICRLAQMARAVGIHLVIATQRPSVNVITGLIKANVPARLAFAVSSATDSRVILDQTGAERLLGKGDMLLLGPSSSIAQRVQGSWVTEDEVRNIAAFWKRQTPELTYDDAVQGATEEGGAAALFGGGAGGGGGDDDDDALLAQAVELVVRSQLGSTSMLQRKLKVGFARAGRIMDLLEEKGVVGPSTGSKAREVLMTPEELDAGILPGSGGGDGFDVDEPANPDDPAGPIIP
jgi:DNA segregation ATPase FtsK/SpoIIIE, S-DNA-T family